MSGRRPFSPAGTVEVLAIGACPEELLSRLAASHVRFQILERRDEITLRLRLPLRDLERARACAEKAFCSLEPLRTSGTAPFLRAMGLRALYPVLLGLIVLLVFWLQRHLMFFTVQGNETIPSEMILHALEAEGVGFFTDADELDMTGLKNRMLTAMPSLGFFSLNREGSFAEIIVRERAETPAVSRSAAPANVVAEKDGMILSVSASAGDAQVQPGQTVRAGQLLISGVTALDRTMLLTRAEGEVYARTWNRVDVLLPDPAGKKIYTGRERVLYRLTIGKKTINFYKSSGISYGSYDKIEEDMVLVLPGGYSLPATLTRIVLREYTLEPMRPEGADSLLRQAADRQLLSEMAAGVIVSRRYAAHQLPGGARLLGAAECREEIGRTVEIKE